MLIPASHHLCWFWFQLSQLSDEAIPLGVDRNVGMVAVECVRVCISRRFMTLISREGGSLLCNLLAPTILPHLRVRHLFHTFICPPFHIFHRFPPSLPPRPLAT